MLPGATVLSGTPRIGPLGIMAGSRVLLQLASADPPARLAPLPASVVCDSALPVPTDLAPVLAGRQAVLAPARASLWHAARRRCGIEVVAREGVEGGC